MTQNSVPHFSASYSRACGRKRRRLVPLARDIVLARADGRPLTHAAWVAGLAGGNLLTQTPQLDSVLAPSAALFAMLCLIALFDARYFVIPDGPTLFLAVTGLVTVALIDPAEMADRLAAAAAGYASIRAVAFAYEKWRGVPGVGQGDARLFALAGLWLGSRGLPSCLIFAVISALISAAVALRAGALSSARDPIPFGPHLALGLWLTWTIGPMEFG